MIYACFKPCIFFSGEYHKADTFETQFQDDNLRLDGQQPDIQHSKVFAMAFFASLATISSGQVGEQTNT